MKSTSTDNPFAVPARKPAIFRSLKTLFVVIVCLGAVLTVQFGSKYWLLHRLTSDWESQPVAVRVERLESLAELGDLGRPMIVQALKDPHRQVAHSAFNCLLDQQADWLALADDHADKKYRQLVEQLVEVAAELPADRHGWLATLLNAAITETVEHSSEDATVAYAQATKLLADNQLKRQPAEAVDASSVRVAMRTDALPVDLEPNDSDDEDGAPSGGSAGALGSSDNSRPDGLQAAPPLEEGELRSLSERSETADMRDEVSSDVERVVVPAQQLTAAPFETYSDRSVIAWLRSIQPKLRDIARSELIRRGFEEPELELAERMADPDIRVRLGLLNDLTHRTDIDPRPWLLWMAEDAERDVRLRALTMLATMQDPNVREKLRERLPHESDPAVVALLRRVLSRR